MTMIGSISAKITADDTEFLTAMGRVKGSLKSQATELRTSANSYAKWGAAAAAAAAVAGAAMVKAAMSTVDELAKTARSIDSSIVGLQGLQLAATEAGVSQEAAASSAQMLNQRLGEAMRGTGQAAEQLEVLGLRADDVAGMAADERFAVLADRMQEMGYSSAQTADALRNLGIRSREVVLLMQAGGDTIRGATKRVQDYGLAIDEVDAAQVESANDAFAFAGEVIQNVLMRAAIEVAPIVQGIANHLTEAAKEAGGFGKVFFNAIDSSISVVGVFADGIHGIKVIIEGLEVAFWGLAHVVNLAMKSAFEGIDSFINGVKESINSVIQGVNLLGADMELLQTGSSSITQYLQGEAAASKKAFDEAANSLHNLAMQEMPSDAMKRWVEDARSAANEVAESVSAAMVGQKTGEDDGGAAGGLNDDEKKKLQEKVEAIRQSNLMEIEALKEKFALEAEVLAQAYENKLLNEEAFKEQMNGITQKYKDEETAIIKNGDQQQLAWAEMTARQKQSIMKSQFSGLSTLMNTESKKLFEIGKAAALSNAFISAGESIVDAYKFGTRVGGPYVGAAFAATAGIAQFANIQNIAKQSYGGGGGAGSSQTYSGGVPATNTTSEGGGQPTSRNVNISLSGSSFGAGGIRDLISEINSAVGDGVQLNAT